MKVFARISGICSNDMPKFQGNTFSVTHRTSEKQKDNMNSVRYQYAS